MGTSEWEATVNEMNRGQSTHEMVPNHTLRNVHSIYHTLASHDILPHLYSLPSPHQLHYILRRPPRLRKTQTPLQTLQPLPRPLITHDMRRPLIALM